MLEITWIANLPICVARFFVPEEIKSMKYDAHTMHQAERSILSRVYEDDLRGEK